jgi:hypothetical protein
MTLPVSWLQEWSIEDFIDLFKRDVENRLGIVENIDDVLNEYIPETLIEIRERCQ